MDHQEGYGNQKRQAQGERESGCLQCPNLITCLPSQLEGESLQYFENLIERERSFAPHSPIYRQGEPFRSLYALKSGAVKVWEISRGGMECIAGFFSPPSIIGFSGIGYEIYTNTATTLAPTTVCEIPFENLCQLSAEVPQLQSRFFQLLSEQIVVDQKFSFVLSQGTAHQRVAAFLVHLRQQYASDTFQLSMTRQEIANFLGLSLETVSRILSEFNVQGWIQVSGKHIAVSCPDEIHSLAREMEF